MTQQYLNETLESKVRNALIPLAEELFPLIPVEDRDGNNPQDVESFFEEVTIIIDREDPSEAAIFIDVESIWGLFSVEIIVDPETFNLLESYLVTVLFADIFSYNLETNILMNSFGVRMSSELFVSFTPLIRFAKIIKSIILEELEHNGKQNIK